jgi:hypothetical protein
MYPLGNAGGDLASLALPPIGFPGGSRSTMASAAFRLWVTTRKRELDEIERAHAVIGGAKPGRRYATQQINRAYMVLIASHFQGYCRDLYTECVDYLVPHLTPATFQASIRDLLTQNLQLKKANAQPGSIGADFGRLGIDFWTEVKSNDPRNEAGAAQLEELNRWRNAIAHQDFAGMAGGAVLQLRQVRRWHKVCQRLARSFDEVMRLHLQDLTGSSPW